MLRSIDVAIRRRPEHPTAEWAITPRPFDHWGQRLHSVEAKGVAEIREIGAENSDCRGYLLRAADPEAGVSVRYTVEICEDCAPDWVWRRQDNRFTLASPGLASMAADVVAGAANQRAALEKLVAHAAEMFGYAHVDRPFNAETEAVPAVTAPTTGSCVDINTYLLAAARSLGIRGQYIAGYWFHPERDATTDMHCWLAFAPDGVLTFWDVAHGLKWAESLGARVTEGLNPAGGRRVGLSCGRGLVFETPVGRAEISHFAELKWLAPEGAAAVEIRDNAMTIAVADPDGDRAQYPGRADAPTFTLTEAAA